MRRGSSRRITKRGSVVIPAEVRRKYALHSGARVQVVDYGGVLGLVPELADSVREAAGMLKGRPSLTRALLVEHRKEGRRARPRRR